LLLGGAVATLASLPDTAPARASSAVMVVYVYAEDCAPCQIFQAQDWPHFKSSAVSRAVRFVRTTAPKTTQAYQVRYWPSEARPFHSAVKVPIVPSFILINHNRVVLVGNGIVGWRNQVLPQLHQLAAS
jgi:hypothetical protein